MYMYVCTYICIYVICMAYNTDTHTHIYVYIKEYMYGIHDICIFYDLC